jgi:hypothetical protein
VRGLTAGALVVSIAACGERGAAQDALRVEQDAAKFVPKVERAIGLPFKRPPVIAVRSREEVRRYLELKLDDELPSELLDRLSLAYRLFGLLPDTVDLRALLLSLYTEQVAGYYDPDSTTLYVIEGGDPTIRRMVLAHELVHALQGQYVPLDSLLDADHGGNDERTAAQAVFEGQATLASLSILLPGRDLGEGDEFWAQYRESVRREHTRMPVFNSAPLVVREGLIFPYLDGASFVRWFQRAYPDTVPFGPRLPRSTEQVLHPERYRAGDLPIAIPPPTGLDVVYSDDLGELETRILMTVLSGSESIGRAAALGWGGDRYAVYRSGGDGHALVWWTAWDNARGAERFQTLLERYWPKRNGARRSAIEVMPIVGRPGLRLIDAPVRWAGWERPPEPGEH